MYGIIGDEKFGLKTSGIALITIRIQISGTVGVSD